MPTISCDRPGQGRHILDAYRAEACVLAVKNDLFGHLEQLPDEEKWTRIRLAGVFGRKFRKEVGRMKKQRAENYKWGVDAKIEKI